MRQAHPYELIDDFRVGDRVRIKAGAHCGKRGALSVIGEDEAMVITDRPAEQLTVSLLILTNYSAISRKRWAANPDRAVGRPRSTKRKPYTMRLDTATIAAIDAQVAAGLLASREQFINDTLRLAVERLGHAQTLSDEAGV